MSENKNNIQYLGSGFYAQFGAGSDGGTILTTVFDDGKTITADWTNNGLVRVENPPSALLEEAKLTTEKEKEKQK